MYILLVFVPREDLFTERVSDDGVFVWCSWVVSLRCFLCWREQDQVIVVIDSRRVTKLIVLSQSIGRAFSQELVILVSSEWLALALTLAVEHS